MIYIAFTPKNIKGLMKELIIFYLVSFAFGGCAFALLYFVRPEDILMRNGVLTGSYPIKIALLGGIVGFVIVNIAFRMVKGRIRKQDMFCNIEIYWKEHSVSVKAFIDTGNLLKDPLTQMSVIVVEKNSLKELIPDFVMKYVEEMEEGKVPEIQEKAMEYMSKFRMIPFSSLGKQNRNAIGVCFR